MSSQDHIPVQDLKLRPAPKFSRRMPLADLVFEDLHSRIVSLELPPHTSLSRNFFCAFYGISQTPLRDALLRLENDGLLLIFPQSRTVVSPINITDVRETQFLRNALEKDITALLAADPGRYDLSEVGDSIKKMERLTDQSDFDIGDFNQQDKAFHGALFSAASKTGLFELVEARSGHLDRIRRLHLEFGEDAKPTRVIEDHRSILGAILEGNIASARAAVERHLSHTLDRLEKLRAHFPDLFD